jgi:hypothetical protein
VPLSSQLVLELLDLKDSFKRSELTDLARTHNLAFNDGQYQKVGRCDVM